MFNRKYRQRFERLILPHMGAAYNLALWLLRDPSEAEDIVQMAYMRAFEAFDSFRGNNSAPWIMTIVRNTAFNYLSKQKRSSNLVSFDEAMHSHDHESKNTINLMPEEMIDLAAAKTQATDFIERLPAEFREVLFLREIEGYSYKEISEITEVPKGTVMSRLSRARGQLQKLAIEQQRREKASGL